MFSYNPATFGLYFAGVRTGHSPGKLDGRLPDPALVARRRQLMRVPARVVRVPLRLGASG